MDQPSTSRRVSVQDSNFGNRINLMLNDVVLSDDDVDSSESVDDSDADPDYVISDDDDGTSEDSLTSDSESDDAVLEGEQEIVTVDDNLPSVVCGRMKKNEHGPGYPWHTNEQFSVRRTPAHNIIRGGLPGLTVTARRLGDNPNKIDLWKMIVDQTIVEQIVQYTNVKLTEGRESIGQNTSRSNYRATDIIEINALFGLLLLSSVLKSNNETVLSLFCNDGTARPVFRAGMSGKRFEILLSCLRFDDAQTRLQRKTTDKAAAVSQIFYKVINNSQKLYCMSEHVTIDEMLVPFRGRCGFRVYMPKKPHKYGIKIMCLTDAKTSFLYNAYIYTGKDSDGIGLSPKEQQLSKPTQSVVRLCKPIQNSNRNVTGDNWFSSMELTEELEKMKLTYVGTMRKDKKVIPNEFLADRNRTPGSVRFGFNGNRTLVSFVPQKNRAVALISTMHHDKSIDEDKNKPEIISFYNSTKCGVDILDMKCAVYASNRRTRRWPVAIFYRLLSIASVNSHILHLCYKGTPDKTRFDFTKELGLDLVEPHLRRRLLIPNLPRNIRDSIKKLLKDDQPQQPEQVISDKMEKRKTCAKCPSFKERKTQYKCIKCHDAICLECSKKVCNDCARECI